MKSLFWFVLGVVGGFVAAHFVNKSSTGHELLAEIDSRIGEFTDRIGDAYRTQEARFEGLLDDAKDTAHDVATDAAATAKNAADALAD